MNFSEISLVAYVPKESALCREIDQNSVGDIRLGGCSVGIRRLMKCKGEGRNGVDEKLWLGYQCQQMLFLLVIVQPGAHKFSALGEVLL